MRFRAVLTSLTFRYTAKYVILLSAGVFLLMIALYAFFTYTWFGELNDSIEEELDTLQIIYRGQSIPGVAQYIDDQRRFPAIHRYYYLVSDGEGGTVAGDLEGEPDYRQFDGGWLGFQMALLDLGEPVDVEFLGRSAPLGDSHMAVVARDYREVVDRAGLVLRTLLRAMIATLFLGLVGGFLSAARALRQVERLNRELAGIIPGDPGQRLDVTEVKGYVRELAAIVNQMLDRMESLMQGVRQVSDNIAHDLRTPLTRIRNQLSQLRNRQLGPAAEEVEAVIAECDELLTSFNALLRISTLETGSRLSGGQPVDLQALLRDLVELYEPVAVDRAIELQLHTPGAVFCRGEVQLLFQMYANVLDNAIKYTPSGGHISIDLSSRGGGDGAGIEHTVIVADDGPGIPLADRKNVFRRFYRLESGRGEQPGHGLGLSLVQAIAHYHHGSVVLGSNSPGLRVKIRLPGSSPG